MDEPREGGGVHPGAHRRADHSAYQPASTGTGAGADVHRGVRTFRARRVLAVVVGLAAVGLALRVLQGNWDELVAAGDRLSTLQPGWLAVATFAEALSYLCYARAQQRLLRCAGVGLGLPVLVPLAVAAQAVADSLPAGLALSNVFSYRMLHRLGVRDVVSVWLLATVSVLYIGVLALLALPALLIAGQSNAVPGLWPTTLALIALFAVVVAIVAVMHRRGLARPIAARLVAAIERASAWRRASPLLPARRWQEQLSTIHADAADWTAAGSWLAASWLADAGCLVVAFWAAGADPPWRGLLLGYCAAQLAASLPITPGGLGVVEGSLTLALVAYGGAEATTLVAVLVYRLVSFWAVLPAGVASYGWLRIRAPRASSLEAITPERSQT